MLARVRRTQAAEAESILGLWKSHLQEESSTKTGNDGPGSIGGGTSSVDVVSSGGSAGVLGTPSSHGDCAGGGDWHARSGSGSRGGGDVASLEFVSGHGGTDKGRCNSEETHCDGVYYSLINGLSVRVLKKARNLLVKME